MTEPMLIEGRKRAEAESLAASLDWVVGDAMALPFAVEQPSMSTRSASASGTSPALPMRWPKPTACCGRAGD
jgi:hypothetical protein